MKERTAERWNATDIARVIYAKYKGLKARQIAFFVDRSVGAVNVMYGYIKNPAIASKNAQKAIEKGQILEARIRNGEAPDERRLWDEQIGRLRGITYSYTKPEVIEPVVEPVVEPTEDELIAEQYVATQDVPKEVVPEPEKEELIGQRPIISIMIDVDTVLKFIKAWK